MTTLGGYPHGLRHIDLTTGSVSCSPIAEEDQCKHLGGRGLGVKYVYENGPHVDALSSDNLICFMNGPGKAARPAYLLVENGEVTLHDATSVLDTPVRDSDPLAIFPPVAGG